MEMAAMEPENPRCRTGFRALPQCRKSPKMAPPFHFQLSGFPYA